MASLKEDGGIGLVDLRNRDIALKAQWPLKLKEKSELRKLADLLIKNPIGETLWEVQLVPKEIKKLFPKAPRFWLNVLEAWFDTTFDNPLDSTQVLEQLIWYNSNVRQADLPIFNVKLYSKGVKYIKDLTKNGKLMSFEEFAACYDFSDYVTFYGLMSVIPNAWKALLNMPKTQNHIHSYHEFSKLDKPIKAIYRKRKEDPLLLNHLHIIGKLHLVNLWN